MGVVLQAGGGCASLCRCCCHGGERYAPTTFLIKMIRSLIAQAARFSPSCQSDMFKRDMSEAESGGKKKKNESSSGSSQSYVSNRTL